VAWASTTPTQIYRPFFSKSTRRHGREPSVQPLGQRPELAVEDGRVGAEGESPAPNRALEAEAFFIPVCE